MSTDSSAPESERFVAIPPQVRMAIGRPALCEGESRNAYDALTGLIADLVSTAVKRKAAVWIWVLDLVDDIWELRRLKRASVDHINSVMSAARVVRGDSVFREDTTKPPDPKAVEEARAKAEAKEKALREQPYRREEIGRALRAELDEHQDFAKAIAFAQDRVQVSIRELDYVVGHIAPLLREVSEEWTAVPAATRRLPTTEPDSSK